MQKRLENTKSRAKLYVMAIAVVAIIFCLSVIFSSQTSIKNDEFYNTYHDFSRNYVRYSKGVATTAGNEYVHIGGRPIGISITARGLIVVGESAVQTSNGDVYPSKNLGIQKGDILISANGESVSTIYGFKETIKNANSVDLTFLRKTQEYHVTIKTAKDFASGENKVGLLLKEDVGGIGTLTFVTQNGQFASLGHFITDAESGLSSELDGGHIYNCEIDGIIKGERGQAGGLVGDVNRLSKPIGDIKMNTNIGLYGVYTEEPTGDLYKIATKGEAKIGRAQVLTTIDGDEPKFYDIDIVKVVSQQDVGEKGMVIVVRDSELIEKTGGIVQGMSGSPIVQNGILIGAVTHVFIQDPLRGYAVHSRFMLDYANSVKTDNLNEQIDDIDEQNNEDNDEQTLELYPLVA